MSMWLMAIERLGPRRSASVRCFLTSRDSSHPCASFRMATDGSSISIRWITMPRDRISVRPYEAFTALIDITWRLSDRECNPVELDALKQIARQRLNRQRAVEIPPRFSDDDADQAPLEPGGFDHGDCRHASQRDDEKRSDNHPADALDERHLRTPDRC